MTHQPSPMHYPLTRFSAIPTPFYHYDLPLLRQTLAALRNGVGDRSAYHVHYAIKANANPRILSEIAAAGLGADCVSGGEIRAALLAGFAPQSIVFAGVGKSDAEIRFALHAHIGLFNVESLEELQVIDEITKHEGLTARVAFRVNPDIDAHTHEKITTGLAENKFGIAPTDLVKAIRMTERMPNVSYAGLHFHIGSQILDLTVYRLLCERILEIQEMLVAEGITTTDINVGGGLGIDYDTPDAHPIPAFSDYFSLFAKHLPLADGQRLHFELGRSIVAQCGTLIARCLYVKQGQVKQFVIVDAGMTELIRPALYGAHHDIQNLSANSEIADEGFAVAAERSEDAQYDVVGPICESSDVFGHDISLPQTKRGDFIAFRSAGAYGEVMASCYNCRSLPPAVFTEA